MILIAPNPTGQPAHLDNALGVPNPEVDLIVLLRWQSNLTLRS